MIGEVFDLVAQPVSVEGFQGLDNAGMQRPPPLLEKAAIGHLLGQDVFEGEGPLRLQARLVEQLGSLKVCQALL